MPNEMGIFEAMRTQRAIRRFKPTPVPDELITKVLDAAIRAPSGSNRQAWYFIVIRDPGVKSKIGEIYGTTWHGRTAMRRDPKAIPVDPRLFETWKYTADHMADAPVLILACLGEGATPRPTGEDEQRAVEATRGASIYPAVQNLLLAARAVGLGTTLTTVHVVSETQIKEILGIPPEVRTAALIPMGYPEDPDAFRPNRRKPVEEVTFYDRWGNPP